MEEDSKRTDNREVPGNEGAVVVLKAITDHVLDKLVSENSEVKTLLENKGMLDGGGKLKRERDGSVVFGGELITELMGMTEPMVRAFQKGLVDGVSDMVTNKILPLIYYFDVLNSGNEKLGNDMESIIDKDGVANAWKNLSNLEKAVTTGSGPVRKLEDMDQISTDGVTGGMVTELYKMQIQMNGIIENCKKHNQFPEIAGLDKIGVLSEKLCAWAEAERKRHET